MNILQVSRPTCENLLVLRERLCQVSSTENKVILIIYTVNNIFSTTPFLLKLSSAYNWNNI